ncbi:MAG: hypothetical protein ACLP07_17510 [Terracidiphilus sp.]
MNWAAAGVFPEQHQTEQQRLQASNQAARAQPFRQQEIASSRVSAWEVCMQAQPHPLEPFFQQIVRNTYEGKLGLHDPDLTLYVARILCDFSQADKLYSIRDAAGRPIVQLEEMERAADPIHGSAASFDAERALRKYIGDYALFVAGMYPEVSGSSRRLRRHQPSIEDLIRAGKESYFIVSQFNLFEYEQEAPLFARLSDSFERLLLGLTLVREDLGPRKPRQLPPRVN